MDGKGVDYLLFLVLRLKIRKAGMDNSPVPSRAPLNTLRIDNSRHDQILGVPVSSPGEGGPGV